MDLRDLQKSTYFALYAWLSAYLKSDILTEPMCRHVALLLSHGILHFSIVAEDTEIIVDYSPEENLLNLTYDNDETDAYVLDEFVRKNIACIVSVKTERLGNLVVAEFESEEGRVFSFPPRHKVVSLLAGNRKKKKSRRRRENGR